MDPWVIIGWMLLGIVGLVLLFVAWIVLMIYVGKTVLAFRVWRDRKIEPKVGQLWMEWWGDRYRLVEITKVEIPSPDNEEVWPTGRIRVQRDRDNWDFRRPEEWKKSRKYFLMEKLGVNS